jgi:hypothetical protein
MDFDDEIDGEIEEVGSDELLSDDNLRLPVGANPLVRLHAVRAWLARRKRETKLEMGEAALSLQELQASLELANLRRREYQEQSAKLQRYQQLFVQAKERLETYEESSTLLEESVNHVTVSERLLVEYYLELDRIVQDYMQELSDQEALAGVEAGEHLQPAQTPRLQALRDVQQRIEHVGASYEE